MIGRSATPFDDAVPCTGIQLSATSSGGEWRALSWNPGVLRVWHVPSCMPIGAQRGREVQGAALLPDGSAVVYADRDELWLWLVGPHAPRRVGRHRELRALAVSPDGEQLLTCGGDRQVKLWNLLDEVDPAEAELRREYGLEPEEELATWHPDARDKPRTVSYIGRRTALVTSGDGSIFVLDTGPGDEFRPATRLPKVHTSGVDTIRATSDARVVVTGSFGQAVAWDLSHLTSPVVHSMPLAQILALSSSGRRMLVTTPDGIVRLTDVRTGAVLAAFEGDRQIASCGADEDLEWIVAADQGGLLHFLHAELDAGETDVES
jgi:WD40 repeat protein